MYSPSTKQPLDTTKLQGARVVRFVNRRDTRYPVLMRLCMDFGFQVLQLHPKVFSHISRKWVPSKSEFILAFRSEDTRIWFSFTRACKSLEELNERVRQQEVDILHDHLFGDEEPDPLLSPFNGEH